MSPRIVIVGGGLEGLSVANHLALRGADVTVLERGELCSAGTAKSSGVIRCHYGVRSLAAMSQYSIGVFEELGSAAGFHQTGYLVGIAQQDIEAMRHNLAMHRSLGVEVEELTPEEAQDLWPVADVSDFGAFAYEPSGGYGDGYQTGMTFGRLAREAGARILRHTEVTRIVQEGDRVRAVETATGDCYEADYVVLAAGPWSPALARPLGVELPIRGVREGIVLVDPGGPLGDLPVFGDLVSRQYVRTEKSGHLLWGNADHSDPEYADPDRYSNQVDVSVAAERLATRFPGLPDPRPTSSYAGIYDVTPDYYPIIDKLENQLIVCAGFSGRGFKMSPAVGRLVADLALDGRSSDPEVDARDFRLSRFAEGKLTSGAHPYGAIKGAT